MATTAKDGGRMKNKNIRARVEKERDERGWKQAGGIRYGLCLFAAQDVTLWAGSTHVQPSAIAFWRSVKDGKNAHKKPRVGDLVFWSGGKYGHVAIYMGKGKILSTDVFVREAMRIGDFHAPETKWGQTYCGAWTPPKLRGELWKDRH
jgi:hypothetical protein